MKLAWWRGPVAIGILFVGTGAYATRLRPCFAKPSSYTHPSSKAVAQSLENRIFSKTIMKSMFFPDDGL